MRNLLTLNKGLVILLLALALFPKTGHAQTTFFSDNFEADNFNKWSFSGPCSTTTELMSDSSNFGGGSGSFAVQTDYPAGITDGGIICLMNINNNPGGANLPDHFKIEYDFKLDPIYHFPIGQKMWRTMNDMNTGAVPATSDVFLNVSMLQHGRSMQVDIVSYSPTFGDVEMALEPTFSLMSVNVWHRLGLRLKKNTFSGSTPNSDGEVELFLDGASVGLLTGRRLAAIQSRWFRDYMGGPLNYTSTLDNNPIPANQWIRVDNFKITDLTTSSALPQEPGSLTVR